MREIAMEMDLHFSSLPQPSSTLIMLVQELKTHSQYRARTPKSKTKQETAEELPKQEALKQETVQTSVVFTLFNATLNLCEALLQAAGITHVRIDGEMKVADRSRAVATFMHDESVHGWLASSLSELRAQYNDALQSLRGISKRMDRERGRADSGQNRCIWLQQEQAKVFLDWL
jgi:superfamily II DNA/RNA helicase